MCYVFDNCSIYHQHRYIKKDLHYDHVHRASTEFTTRNQLHVPGSQNKDEGVHKYMYKYYI